MGGQCRYRCRESLRAPEYDIDATEKRPDVGGFKPKHMTFSTGTAEGSPPSGLPKPTSASEQS